MKPTMAITQLNVNRRVVYVTSTIRTCRFFTCFAMNLGYAAPVLGADLVSAAHAGSKPARRDIRLRLTERQYPVDPSREIRITDNAVGRA
jgi:hypothetical protein